MQAGKQNFSTFMSACCRGIQWHSVCRSVTQVYCYIPFDIFQILQEDLMKQSSSPEEHKASLPCHATDCFLSITSENTPYFVAHVKRFLLNSHGNWLTKKKNHSRNTKKESHSRNNNIVLMKPKYALSNDEAFNIHFEYKFLFPQLPGDTSSIYHK